MKLRLVAAALTVLLGAAAMQVPMADSVAAAHGVDFRSGIIKYILDEPLIEDPNTFESWIKVEEDAEGEIGVIFGNGSVSDTPSVEYAVNAEGQLTVNWNNYERYIVFDKTDVRTVNRCKPYRAARVRATSNFTASRASGAISTTKPISINLFTGGSARSRFIRMHSMRRRSRAIGITAMPFGSGRGTICCSTSG